MFNLNDIFDMSKSFTFIACGCFLLQYCGTTRITAINYIQCKKSTLPLLFLTPQSFFLYT